MARVRHEPRARRSALVADLRAAIMPAIALGALAYAYPRYWSTAWTEPDEATRDRIVRIATLVLAAWIAWALVCATIDAIRWLRARHWERMLDDPVRAHLVPPLQSHVDAVRHPARVGAQLVGSLAAALAGIGLVVYGVVALLGRVPGPTSDGSDATWTLFLLAAVLLFLAWSGLSTVRRLRFEHRIERLSNDAELLGRHTDRSSTATPIDDAVANGHGRAQAVPALEFVFDVGLMARTPAAIAREEVLPTQALRILYLRLFDNIAGTARFVGGPWSQFGYIHVLRSASQVTRAELDEAEDAGSVASMFITSAVELDDALRRQATGRIEVPRPPKGFFAQWRWMFDSNRGRYPVRALLCHGTFWRTAVDLLLDRVDLVVIDLCGYLPSHSGTHYELQRVIDRFPIGRVTLLAEGGTDRRFVVAQVTSMWEQMTEGSPNEGTGRRVLHVVVNGPATS